MEWWWQNEYQFSGFLWTVLSEEEICFFHSILSFAQKEIAPHVAHMDEAAEIMPGIITKFLKWD